MKKIICTILVLALYMRFGGKKASAWASSTHYDLVENALDLIAQNQNKRKVGDFYKDYRHDILSGCVEPDHKGDVDKGSGRHYYSCVNSKGKKLPIVNGYYQNRLGRFSKSARTMFEENYTSAVNLYKSGKIKNAMHVLGRAVHFLEDAGCTVHVSNMRYAPKENNVHYAFEKFIGKNGIFKADRIDKRLTKIYEQDNFAEEVMNRMSKAASRYRANIETLDEQAYINTAKVMHSMIVQNISALLYRFYCDCMTDNDNFVCDEQFYKIKHEATGLVMTVTPERVILDKPDDTKEQVFKISMLDNGAFGLKTKKEGYVSGNFKSYNFLKIGSKPSGFRAACIGKNRFRLTTEDTEYEKVLGIGKKGIVSVEKFDPADPNQIWVIRAERRDNSK